MPEPARRNRVPPEWREATDLLKANYLHAALVELGPVHAFTLNLRTDIEKQARGETNPLDWLRRRIARELDVEGYMTLEEADTFDLDLGRWVKRLHLHGELGFSVNQAKEARRCLRRAGGEWTVNRQHQCQTEPDPDSKWSAYVAKDFWKTTPFVRSLLQRHGSNMAPQFACYALSSTSGVRKRAETLFRIHREFVLSGGKSVLS